MVSHDSAWAEKFEGERALLLEAIGPWVTGGVHHVGSTAVPGLDAKPTIDILLGIESLDSARGCFEPLAGLSYLYAPYRPEEMHWFCKPDPSRREFHLHLVPTGSRRFDDELAFCYLLCSTPEVAREYADLKKSLAVRFRTDREGYTKGKSDFINHALGIEEAVDGELGPEDGGSGAAPAADPGLG